MRYILLLLLTLIACTAGARAWSGTAPNISAAPAGTAPYYMGVSDDEVTRAVNNENKAKYFPGYDALIAGWPKEDYPWVTKGIAEKVFANDPMLKGVDDFKRYSAIIDLHYRMMIGEEPDWEQYQKTRQEEIDRLTQCLEAQKEDYERKERRKVATIAIAVSASMVAIALLVLAFLSRRKLAKAARCVGCKIQHWELHHWAVALCVVLLVIPLIGGDYDFLWKRYELPHAYYTCLRLAMTATAAYLAYLAVKAKAHPLCALLCIAIALLFQPIAPVDFGREIWCWIDLGLLPALVILCTLIGKRIPPRIPPTQPTP